MLGLWYQRRHTLMRLFSASSAFKLRYAFNAMASVVWRASAHFLNLLFLLLNLSWTPQSVSSYCRHICIYTSLVSFQLRILALVTAPCCQITSLANSNMPSLRPSKKNVMYASIYLPADTSRLSDIFDFASANLNLKTILIRICRLLRLPGPLAKGISFF